MRKVHQGYLYCVVWTVDGKPFGPHYMRTLEEAINKRDEIMKRHDKPIPDDFYGRRAYLVQFGVSVEHFEGGQWTTVKDSLREGIWGVDYVD
ncbi:hypothetical protein [Sorangium cellulosum]|uniref:hypothetical protein n=1 Tax=Sorangium cellulosum TaxID=56 RepID=UPI0003F4F9C1|nr:hypothetical protein [Sorangium cellulosum]